jgi:hypothetical protein
VSSVSICRTAVHVACRDAAADHVSRNEQRATHAPGVLATLFATPHAPIGPPICGSSSSGGTQQYYIIFIALTSSKRQRSVVGLSQRFAQLTNDENMPAAVWCSAVPGGE